MGRLGSCDVPRQKTLVLMMMMKLSLFLEANFFVRGKLVASIEMKSTSFLLSYEENSEAVMPNKLHLIRSPEFAWSSLFV